MAPPVRFPLSDHCDGRLFRNPRFHVNRGWREVLRWKRSARPAAWPKWVDLPVRPRPVLASTDTLRVVWVNHATVLVLTRSGTLLIDPVFSACAGPWGRVGPRRVHAPGVAFDQLPPIDVVLLSHDHYDHCDLPSLRRLARRSAQTRLVTALGNGSLVARAGFGADRVRELDWEECCEVAPQLRVTATPARHWSNRLSGRRNQRLWCGFHVRAGGKTVYLAGDTAYDDVMFRHVRERHGAPDLAVLPMGAYEPRWFMAAQHCNPEEAVRIHQELGARRSFGVHWGTFQLTDEAREAPVEALKSARAAAGLSDEQFPLLQPGEGLFE